MYFGRGKDEGMVVSGSIVDIGEITITLLRFATSLFGTNPLPGVFLHMNVYLLDVRIFLHKMFG